MPLYRIDETPQPNDETPQPNTQGPVGESNGGNGGNGGMEDLFSTTIAPVPGEGPVSLPAGETPIVETVETVEPSKPVDPSIPAEPEKPEKPEKPSEAESRKRETANNRVVVALRDLFASGVSSRLRAAVERQHSLLSLLQTALPESLGAFTEYFYAQVQQTLLWGASLLLASLCVPHPLLCTQPTAFLASPPRPSLSLHLHDALLAQIPGLALSPRGILALAAGSRLVAHSGVREILQSLMDYTPESEQLDVERLTDSLQAAQLVQAWTEAANAALRGFCARTAERGAETLWTHAVENPGNGETEGETEGEGEGEGVAEGIVRMVREFYTEFGNTGALLAEKPVKPRDPCPETFGTAGMTEEEEEGEMYAYIEKTMATRVKVLPLEVRAGMQDVWMGMLRTMMKNLQEEVRASVLYDYQFRCLVVNLAFVFSMTSCLLEDAKELREIVQWERCYEPSEVTEEQQKGAVENGIVEFMMMVSE